MTRSAWIATSMAALLAVAGCESKRSATAGPEDEPAPPASAGKASPEPAAIAPEDVEKEVNPSGSRPYSGPTAVVRGTVTVTGDPPPDLSEVVANIEVPKCQKAVETYGKLFRVGPNSALADVLVAVTGYDGYVPAKKPAQRVITRGCAFERRTIAVAYGQRIEVFNKGAVASMPQLLGSKTAALVVAIPGGDPVKLFPTKVGQYALVDRSHPHALADVFVLRYPTVDVTGLDGKFEIPAVPIGAVTVSAYSPATGKTQEKKVTLERGKPAILDFEIAFDAEEYEKKKAKEDARQGAGSAP